MQSRTEISPRKIISDSDERKLVRKSYGSLHNHSTRSLARANPRARFVLTFAPIKSPGPSISPQTPRFGLLARSLARASVDCPSLHSPIHHHHSKVASAQIRPPVRFRPSRAERDEKKSNAARFAKRTPSPHSATFLQPPLPPRAHPTTCLSVVGVSTPCRRFFDASIGGWQRRGTICHLMGGGGTWDV